MRRRVGLCGVTGYSLGESLRDRVEEGIFLRIWGMGGAGPVGWNDGSSSSKGEVRRSGVSSFGAGAAAGGP